MVKEDKKTKTIHLESILVAAEPNTHLVVGCKVFYADAWVQYQVSTLPIIHKKKSYGVEERILA